MRFDAVVLSVFFALVTTAHGAGAAAAKSDAVKAAASLDALLARARIASGAPYRDHVVSVSHESHGGRTFEVTTETDGLKYLARSCSAGICSGFYFDGERSFDANFNDTALPISASVDALQLTLRAIASYEFTAPDFRAVGGQVSERSPVLRDGSSYRRLSIAPFRGALLDAIVDPKSGLVVGVVSDERKYAFEFRDQRRVDGKIVLPYVIALNGVVVERFDRRSIVDTPLAEPAGLVPTFASNDAALPMAKLDRATIQPVVPCAIGGIATTCLLDTGNSGLSMSLEKRLADNGDGHLGSGLLANFIATFDYGRSRVELIPRASDKNVRAAS